MKFLRFVSLGNKAKQVSLSCFRLFPSLCAVIQSELNVGLVLIWFCLLDDWFLLWLVLLHL